MTRDDLDAALATERHGHRNRERTIVLADWTHADHVRHVADALDVSIGQASRMLAETRRAIIDDLPPGRGRTLIVRSRR